jgi:hypothetical protein
LLPFAVSAELPPLAAVVADAVAPLLPLVLVLLLPPQPEAAATSAAPRISNAAALRKRLLGPPARLKRSLAMRLPRSSAAPVLPAPNWSDIYGRNHYQHLPAPSSSTAESSLVSANLARLVVAIGPCVLPGDRLG